MILVHKIRLYPNDEQATLFAKSCGVARFAYNWALAEWKRQYEASEKLNEGKLRKQLNAIQEEKFPWMIEVSKTAPQQAIKNLGTAFKNTFARLKKGEKPGFPKFKRKGIHDSFRAENGPSKDIPNTVKDVVSNQFPIWPSELGCNARRKSRGVAMPHKRFVTTQCAQI